MQLLQPHCFLKKLSQSQSIYGLSICLNVPKGFAMDLEKVSVERVKRVDEEEGGSKMKEVKKWRMVSIPIVEQKGYALNRVNEHFLTLEEFDKGENILVRIYGLNLSGSDINDWTSKAVIPVRPVPSSGEPSGPPPQQEPGKRKWPEGEEAQAKFEERNVINDLTLLVP